MVRKPLLVICIKSLPVTMSILVYVRRGIPLTESHKNVNMFNKTYYIGVH